MYAVRLIPAILLAVLLATPALGQPLPAAQKRGGQVTGGPQTLTMPPDHTRPKVPHPRPIAGMVKTYTDSRDVALKGLTDLVKNPPNDPNAGRAKMMALMEGPQQHLVAISKVVLDRRKSRTSTGLSGFDIQAERERLEKIFKLVALALEQQIRMAKTRVVLEKAIKDTPQLIKALAEELQAVQDKAKEYLKGVGQRIDARERQLAEMKAVMEREREKIRKEGEAKLKARMAEIERQRSLLGRVEREMASVQQSTMSLADRSRRVQELEVKHGQAQVQVQKAQVAAAQTRVQVDAEVTQINSRLRRVEQELSQASQKVGRWLEQRRKDQESAERFIQIVSSNVQHVWQNMLKANQELMEKKQHKPDTHKKQVTVIGTQAQQIVGADNMPQVYKVTASQIQVHVAKGHVQYSKKYADAVQVRKPLVTGSAIHGISIFKGVKPSEITARAKQTFIDMLRKKRKDAGHPGSSPARQGKFTR